MKDTDTRPSQPVSAPRFEVRAKVSAALGSGPSTNGRKLIVAEGLGRELGLDKIVAEPVYPGRADMPDEVELWLWLAWEMCEHAGWGLPAHESPRINSPHPAWRPWLPNTPIG